MTAKKFVFDVSWVMISQIITLIITLIFYVILGKVLGPGPLGLYTITLTIYNILGIFAGVGIPQAIVKFVSEFKEDQKKLDSIVYSSIINTAIFGIIVGILLFIFSGLIADIFKMSGLKVLLQIIAISIPFLSVNNTILGILNGQRKMKSYSLRAVFRSVLLISFTILFLIWGLGITGVILALLISEIGTFILMIIVSLHYFTFSLDMYTQNSKTIIKFGSYLLIATVLFTLITSMDKLFVGYFLNAAAVGIYGIAYVGANILTMIPSSISTVTYPMMSSYHSTKQHLTIQNLIQRSMRYCLVILSLMGLLMVFLSKPLILLLLKPVFLPAIIPLAILIFGNIFSGGLTSVGSSWTAMERPDLTYKILIVYIVVGIGLYIWLIPILGVIGAAIATAASQILNTLIAFPIYKRSFDIRIEVKKYIFSVSIIGVLIASFFILQKYMNIYLIIALLLIVYLIIVVKFILTKDDLHHIRLVVKNRSFRSLF
jgi:stage V sporulation protein B